MAATGEWRDEVSCSKLTNVSLEHSMKTCRFAILLGLKFLTIAST